MGRLNPADFQLQDRTVVINRVAKVVKGGKRFHLSSIMVAGDEQGHVGVGHGKAKEVPEVIRKGIERAKKSLVTVPLKGGTIPFAVAGRAGATKVILKPAAPGTGVIAGSVVRAILELAGVKNVLTKVIGSTNPYNVTKATMDGLFQLNQISSNAEIRKRGVAAGGEARQGQGAPSLRRDLMGESQPKVRRDGPTVPQGETLPQRGSVGSW